MANNQNKRFVLSGLKKYFDNKTGLLSKTNLDEKFVRKPAQFIRQGVQNVRNARQSNYSGSLNNPNMFKELANPDTWRRTSRDMTTLANRSDTGLGRTGATFASSLAKNHGTGTSLIRSGIQNKNLRDIGVGAYKVASPSIAIAGGPMKALVATGMGAGISAGMAKLMGEDPYAAAGEGALTGLKTRAVTQFTDPFIDSVLGKVAPQASLLTRQFFKRAGGGLFNIAEDEIISKLEGEEVGSGERLTSFIIGAVISGNDELLDMAKKNLKAKGFNLPSVNKLVNKTKKFVSDNTEQYQLSFKLNGKSQTKVLKKGDASGWTAWLDSQGIKYNLSKGNTQTGSVSFGTKSNADQLKELVDQTKTSNKIDESDVLNGKFSEEDLKQGYADWQSDQKWRESDGYGKAVAGIENNKRLVYQLENEYVNQHDKESLKKLKDIFVNNYKTNEVRDWFSFDQGWGKFLRDNLNTKRIDGKSNTSQLKKLVDQTKPATDVGNTSGLKAIENKINKMKTNKVMDDVTKQKYYDSMMTQGRVIYSKSFNEKKFADSFESAWSKSKNIDDFKANFGYGKIKAESGIFKDAEDYESFKATSAIEEPIIESPKLEEAKIIKPDEFEDYVSIGDNKSAIKSLEKSLPSKRVVTPEQVGPSFNKGKEGYKSIENKIFEKIKGKVSDSDFNDLVENGTKTGDPIIDEAVEDYIAMTNSLYDMMEDTNVGKIEQGYTPTGDGASVRASDVDELFPGSVINQTNIGQGHLKTKTGALTDYQGNIKTSTDDLIEQAMYHKYRGIMAPVSKNKQVILDELNNVDKTLKEINFKDTPKAEVKAKLKELRSRKPLDYVNLTKSESSLPKSDVEFKVDAKLGTNTVRRDSNVFERMKNPEMQKAFQMIKDGDELFQHRQIKTDKILSLDDKDTAIVDYWTKELDMSGKKLDNFKDKAKYIVNRVGATKFNQEMLNQAYRTYPIENFLETLGKVNVKELSTQEYINGFIHRNIIKNRLNGTAYDNVLDTIGRTMANAQIGLNLKVAGIQPLEATKVPFLYGLKNAVIGLKKSIFDGKRMFKDYAIGKEQSNYDFKNIQTSETKFKSDGPIKKILYAPLQAAENWKNRIFAGAIESKLVSKEMPIGSKELRDAVREEFPKYALPGGKFESPVALKESSTLRLGLQYSNFAIGGAMKKVDAIQDKEYKKALGLAASDLINIGIVWAVTGQPLKWLVQGMVPVGTGPITTLPLQIYSEVKGMVDNIDDEGERKKASKALLDLAIGNMVPGGSQWNKSSRTFDTLKKGYDTSPSGAVKYLAPDTDTLKGKLSAGLGMLLGESALLENREYYSNDRRILGKNQSATLINKSKEDRQTYYKQLMTTRALKKDSKTKVKTSSTTKVDTEMTSGDYDLINERIKVGDTSLSSNELKAYYLKGADLTDSSRYGAVKAKKAVFTAIGVIDKNENLTQAQKDQLYVDLAKSAGESVDNLKYYKIANEDNAPKIAYVLDEIDKIATGSKDRTEMLRYLASGRKVVNGEKLVADGVLTELYDMGLISAAERSSLKKFSFTDDGETGLKVKSSGRGSGAKLKSVTFKAPKISSRATTGYKIPTVKATKTPSSSNSGLRVSNFKTPQIKSSEYTAAPAAAIEKIRQGNRINL